MNERLMWPSLQVSFGGGQKVVQATGNPEEENPFHFRLKNRYVLFVATAPRQAVLPPVRVAAAPDVVDLTVRSFSLMEPLPQPDRVLVAGLEAQRSI